MAEKEWIFHDELHMGMKRHWVKQSLNYYYPLKQREERNNVSKKKSQQHAKEAFYNLMKYQRNHISKASNNNNKVRDTQWPCH
jgi:hypothetical protein